MNTDKSARTVGTTSRVEVRGPSGFLYGSAVFTPGRGWRFLPNVAGRMPSRKFHATSEASIPQWARRGSRVDMLIAGTTGPVEVEVIRAHAALALASGVSRG
jgi:hypothetical protein